MGVLKGEPRYTIELTEHRSGKRFRLDLYENCFAPSRNFIVEVDGKPSEKVPVASKTKILDVIRRWLVAH